MMVVLYFNIYAYRIQYNNNEKLLRTQKSITDMIINILICK